ncbi:threonine/serine dehydratase [Desertibaculum subflavum]|uniref:threonine/serine dehydratase n=1 Tax=Desertibaculum subflavum TaxID=2268458 RepID=UPI0034D33FE0
MSGSVTTEVVTIDDVRAAAKRIAGAVRRTPVLRAAPARDRFDFDLTMKLECLQASGSFKARGASNKTALLPAAEKARGLVTASGGNHGLGVAYAAANAGVPATIFLPSSTPASKVEKLKAWGADTRIVGQVWDEANAAALDFARDKGAAYLHPFADAAVIAGQGTIALELAEQAPELDHLIVAIGGGGLISGVAMAARALNPRLEVIGVEPVGAPTLHESCKAGRLVTLDRIATRAGTLAPKRSEQINLDLIRAHVAEIVLVDDDDMQQAAEALWFDFGLAVELSAAAAYAALRAGAFKPPPGAKVGILVCGAGTDGIKA